MSKLGIKIHDIDGNPTISSDKSEFEIPYKQTEETLLNPQTYNRFIKHIESKFRTSLTYRAYKAYLMEHGLNRCFLQSNITTNHCTIEMHHHILTLYDIVYMIIQHKIKTQGSVSSFEIIKTLKEEHKNNNIAIVMLTKTNHEVNHNTYGMYIHPDIVIGNWMNLIEKYHKGISPKIANKIIRYIDMSTRATTTDGNLLKLRNQIINWSEY